MIVDVITFNGEHDLFKLRYDILKDVVDEFIVVEFDKTFSGRPKEQQFVEHWDKVKYFWHDEGVYNKYMDLAKSSPNTQGAAHWKREFCQKESIKDALTHLQDEDKVFIGDCDEIWDKSVLEAEDLQHDKLKLKVYTYYLNNRSSELFWGTLYTRYKFIKTDCLNHARTYAPATLKDYGWHFTSLKDNLRQKLLDSYTKETYANPAVMSNLEDNVNNNKDFLGRAFTYRTDETDWPPWLTQHRQDYKHLLK